MREITFFEVICMQLNVGSFQPNPSHIKYFRLQSNLHKSYLSSLSMSIEFKMKLKHFSRDEAISIVFVVGSVATL